MDAHNELVEQITAKIRTLYANKVPFKIYHGSTNSTRNSNFHPDRIVDTSKLNRVVHVDTQNKTALVEPNVGMDGLVAATLPHGLVPPVVMEFPGITAGGGTVGMAGESSSYRHGFFSQTVNWMEVILANGEKIRASPEENADLFSGFSGSFGTLGVLTLLEVRLIEAKEFVEVTYTPITSIPEACNKIEAFRTDSSIEYIDGILFSANNGVIVTGKLSNGEKGGRKQGFMKSTDPWHYLHAQKLSKARKTTVELTPLVDYLFRYDRGAFWTGRYAYKYFITPFNRITRWALDYFMHTRVMYHALHKSGHSKMYIIQDLAIPVSKVQEFLQFTGKEFGIYPIWLCPLREDGKYAGSPGGNEPLSNTQENMLNVGVWGPGPTNYKKFVEANRRIEKKVSDLGGIKWLYAQAFYTREEFWNIYNKAAYEELRVKYNATSLPDVYDKVNVDLDKLDPDVSTLGKRAKHVFWSVWPVSGVYGVLSAMLKRDYLLPRN